MAALTLALCLATASPADAAAHISETSPSALDGAPTAQRAAALTLSFPETIKGEKARASGRFSTGVSRPVRLQYRAGARWVTVASTNSSRNGAWSALTSKRAARGTYRALAPAVVRGGAKLPQTISKARGLAFTAQRGDLQSPRVVTYSRPFAVVTTFTPVRPGRPVALQRRGSDGQWRTVSTTVPQTTGGKATWTRTESGHETVAYRAVAMSWRGAPPATSAAALVSVQAPAPQIATEALQSASVGRLYSVGLRTTDDRRGTWVLTSGALPAGISIDGATGQISGTPLEAESMSFTVTYTDAWQQSASHELTLTVNPRMTGTNRILSDPDDSSGPYGSGHYAEITADGAGVLFASYSRLDVNDVDNDPDLFRWDVAAESNSEVRTQSLGSAGFSCFDFEASADGRYVACAHPLQELVVLDTLTGNFESPPNRATNVGSVAISADGSHVAYWADPCHCSSRIFVWDRLTQTTDIVSVTTDGGIANGSSPDNLAISSDGRYVSFQSAATDLVEDTPTSANRVYIRDTSTNTTTLVTHDPSGEPVGDDESYSDSYSGLGASFSADDRFLAFTSAAPGIVAGDDNGSLDAFRYDLASDTNLLVSHTPSGHVGASHSMSPEISADGRYVAFNSNASDLIPSTTPVTDTRVFLFDAETDRVEQVSHAPDGRPAGGFVGSITSDGSAVAYYSPDKTIAPGAGAPGAQLTDVFLWSRG